MRLRSHLSYANVMVTLLAFVVIFSGGAYAASQLGKGSVGTKQLKNNAVTSGKVKNGTLSGKDLKKGLLLNSGGYQGSGSVNFDTFSSSLFGSTVVTIDVPPGAYLATATAEVDTVNAVASTVTCRLINGNGGVGSSAISREQTVNANGAVDNMTLTALFDVTDDQALNLQCSKSANASGARVTDANIVAVRISDVTTSPGG